MGFQSVPIEDIRANRMTFEDFIMRCFDRMDMVLPECVKEENYRIIGAKVRLLHATMHFFNKVDPEYQAKADKVAKEVEQIQGWNYEYYLKLMDWIELMSDRFQHVGIVGAIKTTIEM